MCERFGAGVVNENFDRTLELTSYINKVTSAIKGSYTNLFEILTHGLPRNDSAENPRARFSLMTAMMDTSGIIESMDDIQFHSKDFKK